MHSLIDQIAIVKHLNIRKQGPDEDKVLAIDIKFSDCPVPVALLARILGSDEGTCLLSFWDADQNIRFPGLEPLRTWGELSGLCLKLGGGLNPLRLRGDAKRFVFQVGGESSVVAEFQFTVTQIPDRATALLAELVTEPVGLVVWEEQPDMFESGHEEAA